MILTVGLYYGYSARNANVLFDERHYLFYALIVELMFSSIYYTIRTVYPIPFHEDIRFAVSVLHSLMTNNLALIIIFLPKVSFLPIISFIRIYLEIKILKLNTK